MLPNRKDADERGQGLRRQCGLCGKVSPLTKTPCCGHWICDDYDRYEPFSFAQVSCQRRHERYTLCARHFSERHEADDWRSCGTCKWDIDETEMYVWLGTNPYNFITLENPPGFEPTHCVKCRCIIHLGTDAYSRQGDTYACNRCFPLLKLGA